MSGNRWEDYFGDLLVAQGYDDFEIFHDPAYGWTIDYRAGEINAMTTTAVERRIKALPKAVAVLPTEETEA